MTVDTRDILLKAAEDVTQGMWCKERLFADEPENEWYHPTETQHDLELALASRRCAVGSITVATALLGGTAKEKWDAVNAATAMLTDECQELATHNDDCLPDDPFEAGQQLAELFRQTAESL